MAKVKLIAHTSGIEEVVATAYKICYSPQSVDKIIDDLEGGAADDFLSKVLAFGHESPVEHATFTFSIEGVSRALLAQITRHRIASFSVRSQRYVNQNQFEYVTPPEIEGDEDAREIFVSAMENAQKAYESLADILSQKHEKRLVSEGANPAQAKKDAAKFGAEDARFVLPNACQTQMIATFNVRSLYNFFALRCCNRAQWEIRDLAWQMLDLCKEHAPVLFAKAGPACLHGRCGEGNMSCKKADEVRAAHL